MAKIKNEEVQKNEEVITDIVTIERFKDENGVNKAKRVHMNGESLVKEDVITE